eukprot:scaffold54146_cov29-Prasinocladus_malaysianus.AAC.1
MSMSSAMIIAVVHFKQHSSKNAGVTERSMRRQTLDWSAGPIALRALIPYYASTAGCTLSQPAAYKYQSSAIRAPICD